MKEKGRDRSSDVEELTSAALRELVVSLRKQAELREKVIRSLNKQLSDNSELNKQLQEVLAQQEERIRGLENELASSSEEKDTLSSCALKAEEALMASQAEVASLKEQLAAATAEPAELKKPKTDTRKRKLSSDADDADDAQEEGQVPVQKVEPDTHSADGQLLLVRSSSSTCRVVDRSTGLFRGTVDSPERGPADRTRAKTPTKNGTPTKRPKATTTPAGSGRHRFLGGSPVPAQQRTPRPSSRVPGAKRS